MPFGLGFFAAGGGAAAAAGYTLIQSSFISTSTASITFSSIPTTFRHLQIRGVARNSDAAFQRDFWMQMNGATTSVYSKHQLQGVQTSVGTNNPSGSNTRIDLVGIIANSDTSDTFTPFIIDIFDYAQTTKTKTIKLFGGRTGGTSQEVIQLSGMWNSTDAINSILLDFDSGNFMANSRVSLYGLG